jgi:alkaline phosphatase
MNSIILLAIVKYIFLFIGDGMSTPQRMMTEAYSVKTGCGPLAMNTLPYQANTRTGSANATVTDSAASATAIACGEKTRNGILGLAPDGRRLESVAEVAKKRGMKVGIVTTVAIVHATPAGFYAHRQRRGKYYQIGLDLVASGFDYFAGGWYFGCEDDRDDPEYRGNVFELAGDAGYTLSYNRETWEALKPGSRSICVFGSSSLPFDIDHSGDTPRLYELVEKGIELLDGPDGFFIMCEGGKIDYACHANDAATAIQDVLALDRAVKSALAFQEKHPDETLIITTGDHETGGLALGLGGDGSGGPGAKIGKLAAQKISVESFSSEIKKFIAKKKVVFDDVRPLLAERFGLEDLNEKETALLVKAFDQDVKNVKARLKDTTAHDLKRRYVFAQAVKDVITARVGIAWSTHSHTALPTFTTAKGAGAEILVGMLDNTEIGIRLKKLISGKECR